MKNALVILAVLATGVVVADTTVESSNTFGLAMATGAAGWKIVSVPVAGYAGEGNISIAEILQTSNLEAGDELYTLAESGTYNRYTLNENKSEWTSANTVTIGANGVATETTTPSATTATIARGQAFWLNTDAESVYLMGEATTGNCGVDVAGQAVAGKWNLIGNSNMTNAVEISSIAGTKGDVIRIFDDEGNEKRYVCGGENGWSLYNPKGSPRYTAATGSDVIKVGQGFMYQAKADKKISEL